MTPETRKEKYLAKASGDYSGELPEPVTREEKYLFKIAESGGGGDSSAYAHSLELTINSQTYVLTATLKNTDGEALGTPQTIDLPLETMVVNGTYDNTTKKVILTLKNGNTVDFSVADLVSGLQSEITSSNKLNSDLVDDTNQNNKFVTSAEKTKIANALTEEVYNAGKQITTNNKTGEIFNNYDYNKATGTYSHAEGHGTQATGTVSHAEGSTTQATGAVSHAEGMQTKAIGDYSHAEGISTTTSGNCSHAEGNETTASGYDSHAEGHGTIAASGQQHVQGKYNIADSNRKYAFIIGNGTDKNNRSNAFAVDWDGLIYVNNASTGVNVSQLQPLINSSNKISADFVDDSNSINKFGLPTINIDFSKSDIDTIPEDKRYLIQENKPFAFRNTEEGAYSEYLLPLYVAKQTTETGGLWSCELQINSYRYAVIHISLATFTYLVQYYGIDTTNIDDSNSPKKFVTSAEKTKIANALTEEVYNAGKQVITDNKIGEIFNNYTTNKATGNLSHAEGSGTTASGTASHAEGATTLASGTYSHAEGGSSRAVGDYSHAEGRLARASGVGSHAEGDNTIASSSFQHVQGKFNIQDSNGEYSFIIGNGTSDARSNAFAVDWEGKIYINNAETGVDVSDLLARIIVLENKVAALENA